MLLFVPSVHLWMVSVLWSRECKGILSLGNTTLECIYLKELGRSHGSGFLFLTWERPKNDGKKIQLRVGKLKVQTTLKDVGSRDRQTAKKKKKKKMHFVVRSRVRWTGATGCVLSTITLFPDVQL